MRFNISERGRPKVPMEAPVEPVHESPNYRAEFIGKISL